MHKIGVDNVIVMFELPIELKLGHDIRLMLVIVLVLTLWSTDSSLFWLEH